MKGKNLIMCGLCACTGFIGGEVRAYHKVLNELRTMERPKVTYMDYYDKTMQNYLTRIVEPILSAIVDEIKRKFLTKTARSQKQSILFFRDPFKLVPVDKIAEMTDKFTRNEVMTSNEIRQKIGMKPSSDPKADELRNSNLSAPAESTPAATPKEDNNQNEEET